MMSGSHDVTNQHHSLLHQPVHVNINESGAVAEEQKPNSSNNNNNNNSSDHHHRHRLPHPTPIHPQPSAAAELVQRQQLQWMLAEFLRYQQHQHQPCPSAVGARTPISIVASALASVSAAVGGSQPNAGTTTAEERDCDSGNETHGSASPCRTSMTSSSSPNSLPSRSSSFSVSNILRTENGGALRPPKPVPAQNNNNSNANNNKDNSIEATATTTSYYGSGASTSGEEALRINTEAARKVQNNVAAKSNTSTGGMTAVVPPLSATMQPNRFAADHRWPDFGAQQPAAALGVTGDHPPIGLVHPSAIRNTALSGGVNNNSNTMQQQLFSMLMGQQQQQGPNVIAPSMANMLNINNNPMTPRGVGVRPEQFRQVNPLPNSLPYSTTATAGALPPYYHQADSGSMAAAAAAAAATMSSLNPFFNLLVAQQNQQQQLQLHQQQQQTVLKEHCVICGDTASGYHYGVMSCEGCKGFFRRSVQKRMQYHCGKSGTCGIDRISRNRCQHCRFDKCIKAGMNPETVRPDKNNRKRKSGFDGVSLATGAESDAESGGTQLFRGRTMHLLCAVASAYDAHFRRDAFADWPTLRQRCDAFLRAVFEAPAATAAVHTTKAPSLLQCGEEDETTVFRPTDAERAALVEHGVRAVVILRATFTESHTPHVQSAAGRDGGDAFVGSQQEQQAIQRLAAADSVNSGLDEALRRFRDAVPPPHRRRVCVRALAQLVAIVLTQRSAMMAMADDASSSAIATLLERTRRIDALRDHLVDALHTQMWMTNNHAPSGGGRGDTPGKENRLPVAESNGSQASEETDADAWEETFNLIMQKLPQLLSTH